MPSNDFGLPSFRYSAQTWASAEGCSVTTIDGRTYLDMAMGFGSVILGHGYPLHAISTRWNIEELPHGLGDLHGNEHRVAATKQLTERVAESANVPADTLSSLILHSGSEAVEMALKTAMLANDRSRIIAFSGSYHGTVGLALAVTDRDEFRDPFRKLLNTSRVEFHPYGVVPELDESVCCVIVEPIQGRAGVISPPPGFVTELVARCADVGAVSIVDSVMTGGGRTTFGFTGTDCLPDVLCLGKAIGGGLPIGAVVINRALASRTWGTIEGEAIHTSTALGHPLHSAAVRVMLDDVHPAMVTDAHQRIATAMTGIACGDLQVRGNGALWAFDTGTSGGGLALYHSFLERGIIVVPSGTDASSLTVFPALTINDEQLAVFASTFSSVTETVTAR